MTNHQAPSAVILPVALRKLWLKIEDHMHANPRLQLPYNPQAKEIWKYYSEIKVVPIVMDKLLVILLTIPVLDKTLELNIYQVNNLPSVPPGQEVEALHQLESKYFTIGKHGMYVTFPTEQSVSTCLKTELAICQKRQLALTRQLLNQWAMTYLRLSSLLFNHENRRQCLSTLQ